VVPEPAAGHHAARVPPPALVAVPPSKMHYRHPTNPPWPVASLTTPERQTLEACAL
jgi:hypothetical protein